MEFTKSYNVLLAELHEFLTEEQRQCFLNMRWQYDTLDKNLRALHSNVDGIEKQNDKLTIERQELQKQNSKLMQEKSGLEADALQLTDKIVRLKNMKQTLEDEILGLESSHRGLAIKKGKVESNKKQFLELITNIYHYTENNKCQSQESFEKQIIRKIKEVIPESLLK